MHQNILLWSSSLMDLIQKVPFSLCLDFLINGFSHKCVSDLKTNLKNINTDCGFPGSFITTSQNFWEDIRNKFPKHPLNVL